MIENLFLLSVLQSKGGEMGPQLREGACNIFVRNLARVTTRAAERCLYVAD